MYSLETKKETKKTFNPAWFFLKTIWFLLRNIVYYSSAFIIALVLVVSGCGYFAYYSYNNYYQGYLEISKKWTELDDTYVKDITFMFNAVETLSSKVDEFDWSSQDANSFAKSDLQTSYRVIKEADYAMTYKDKVTKYKELKVAQENLSKIAKTVGEASLSTQISNIFKDNEQAVEEYNSLAKDWNMEMQKYPLNFIAEIVNFDAFIIFN